MLSMLSFRGALSLGRSVCAAVVGAQRSVSTFSIKKDAAASSTSEEAEVEDVEEPRNVAWITKLNDSPVAERAGLMELSNYVFGQPFRPDILHRVVVYQRAGWRQGTVKVKNRAEVRGSGRKIRPQKGTGKSRASSLRAPLFRGGGVVHGPVPRDFSIDLPKKVVNLGIRVALSTKYAQGDLHIVDSLDVESHKTKLMQKIFDARGWKSALVLTPSDVPVNFSLAAGNLPGVDIMTHDKINVYDLLLREVVILTPQVVDSLESSLTKFIEEPDSGCQIFWSTPKAVEQQPAAAAAEDLSAIPDITSKN